MVHDMIVSSRVSVVILTFLLGVSVLSLADEAVYATVGDVPVTLEALKEAFVGLSKPVQAEYRRQPSLLTQYADSFVELEILAQEAKRRGYDSREQVQRARGKALRTTMASALRRESDAIKPTQEALAAYYKAHESEINKPEFRGAHHIAFETEEAAAAFIKANRRRPDLAVFRRTAMKESLDAESKLRGGDLGFFSADGIRSVGDRSVAPELAKEAFRITARGQISSKPISVGKSFNVVFLSAIQPAVNVPLETAAPNIARKLKQMAFDESRVALLGAARKRYGATVNYELVDGLTLPLPNEAPTQ